MDTPTTRQLRDLLDHAREAGNAKLARVCMLALDDVPTAGVYRITTGDSLAHGLPPSFEGADAAVKAEEIADLTGSAVLLADDDGDWIIFPMTNGERQSAYPFRSWPGAIAECADVINTAMLKAVTP